MLHDVTPEKEPYQQKENTTALLHVHLSSFSLVSVESDVSCSILMIFPEFAGRGTFSLA